VDDRIPRLRGRERNPRHTAHRYDGKDLRGGWSPACLNWDSGVPAHDAQIDTTPPDGLSADDVSPAAAAALAGQWFADHIARWRLAQLEPEAHS